MSKFPSQTKEHKHKLKELGYFQLGMWLPPSAHDALKKLRAARVRRRG